MIAPETFQKKPVRVKAVRWTGSNSWVLENWGANIVHPNESTNGKLRLWVEASQGWLSVAIGEWIIQDASGFYPCNADRFAETYEQVPAPSVQDGER